MYRQCAKKESKTTYWFIAPDSIVIHNNHQQIDTLNRRGNFKGKVVLKKMMICPCKERVLMEQTQTPVGTAFGPSICNNFKNCGKTLPSFF